MTVIFSDNFNRASLGTTNWADDTGTYSIESSTVLACSSGAFRAINTTVTAHAAIADVMVTAKRASVTFDGCLIARSSMNGATSTAGDCYFMNIFETDSLEFFRRIGSSSNLLGSTFTGVTHSNGDTFSLKVTGTGATVTLTGYINGVQVATLGDSSGARILVPGQTGFVGFNASSRYDDFSVDNLLGGGSVLVRSQGGLDGGMSSYTGGMR